jgi:heavy metal sensor kinase
MKPRSLRVKLTLWFSFIFSFIIFLSDYVGYRGLERLIMTELDSSLISTATIASAAFKDSNTIDLNAISRGQKSPRFVPQFLQIVDASGSVIGEWGAIKLSGPILDKSQLADIISGEALTDDRAVNNQTMRIAAIGDERAGQHYAVVVGTSAEGVRYTTVRIALILLIVDIVTVVASVAGGYLIIGRALRPVDHITERARQIGAGDLHQRLEYTDSSSEMASLTSVLNEMFDRLQRMFESQKQFVQDASHEIRSPLAALRLRLEVALRQPRSAEEYRRVIESSLQDVERLTALAEDLFLLARADSNNLTMELREISLCEVLSGVCDQLMPLAESRHVELRLEADSPCFVYADRVGITRAFRNIVENALKYTPPGGKVKVTVRPEGDQIRTDVEDTGVGIPIEEQANIFRRFYRVDHARSRDAGGTGLGLAICDQIIRAHQGRLEVESAPGQGSRFKIYLASAAALLEETTV